MKLPPLQDLALDLEHEGQSPHRTHSPNSLRKSLKITPKTQWMRAGIVSLLVLGVSACGEPAPDFQSLQVTSLTDAERTTLYTDYQPRLNAALNRESLIIHEPIAAIPPGHPGDTAPGPVLWEIQMPMVDVKTGESFLARLGKDRRGFIIEPMKDHAPLLDAEATLALKVARADSIVAPQLDAATRAGWQIDEGAMWTESTDSCTGRCVDVRFLGQRHGSDGSHQVSSIIHATVSLGKNAVVSTIPFDWQAIAP